jgi:hypothetical protein
MCLGEDSECWTGNLWAKEKVLAYTTYKLYLYMYCIYQGSVVDPHRFNADRDPDPVLNPGSMEKNWRKKIYSWKNGYFFDKKLQFSYHKASIKDAQAKGKALKKEHPARLKIKILYFFLYL